MKVTEGVAWLAVPTFLLAACLFPSFDELTAPAQPGEQNASNTDPDSDGGSDGGRKPSTTLPDGGTENDGGGTALPKRIGCGSAGTCDPTTGSYCCFAFGAPECKPGSESPFCESTIRCDGNEDCAAGQVCCLPSTGLRESSCTDSCDGVILCDPVNPQCPNAKTCRVFHDHDGTFKSFSCQ